LSGRLPRRRSRARRSATARPRGRPRRARPGLGQRGQNLQHGRAGQAAHGRPAAAASITAMTAPLRFAARCGETRSGASGADASEPALSFPRRPAQPGQTAWVAAGPDYDAF
jgi:hypothetical protein